MKNSSIQFNKDYSGKKIIVTCKFNVPLSIVWDAFTNPVTLAKWFAPKPFQAVTKTMDFKNGGRWLYYMLSPKGEKFWSTSEFKNIQINKSFEASDAFCDENGVINTDFPQGTWLYNFSEENGKTIVISTLIYASEEDMKKILEMGFEEGYRAGLTQLQELL